MRSSWLPLVAVTLLTIAAEGVGVIGVQRQIQAGAQHDATKTAQLISALMVERNMTADNLRAGSVTSGSLHDMDADVAKLIGHGQMSGLQVWSTVDGRLMYAAGDRDPSETVLPQDELIRARRGGFSSIGHSRAGIETFDVFVTFDADGDDLPDVVVEVLLYEDPINADIIRSTVFVYSGALVVAVLITSAAWRTHRRRRLAEYRSRHDLPTGLGNRTLLLERINAALASRANDAMLAVTFHNLDGFRQVNETLGRHAGDDLLVAYGNRLAASCRTTETVVRLAGDEFALLLTDPTDGYEVERRVHQLCEPAHQSFEVGGLEVELESTLPEFVMNSIADARLPAKALELAITETAVAADPVRALKSLEQIRRTGVTISLDDFGTGYTALAQLSGFPIDGLKIDRTFIRLVDIDRSHQAIVRNIIKLSHDLGLFVVAEGVEEVRTASASGGRGGVSR
jgi:diguanylate cyclase (GGDEF)-like protein